MKLPGKIPHWLAPVIVLTACASLWAAKEFVMPTVQSAATYPSKDTHPMEKVTAAVDPYDAAPKTNIFVTNFGQEGILPVLLIITNDGDQPISLTKMKAQLITGSRSKLDGLDTDDVFRRVAHIKASSTTPARVGPLPIPGGGAKNKKAQEQYSELLKAKFTAVAVEPHSTQVGFLFFDVEGIKNPVAGSKVYLTGVRDGNGNDLMYFEIPVIPANAATGQ